MKRLVIVIAVLLGVAMLGWQLYAMAVWTDPSYREPRGAATTAPIKK